MIRVGIVGCNYGRTVLLPAFRLDPRCQVVALTGSDAARTAELARQADVPQAYGDWRRMIERDDIHAVAIAVPPRLQPEIAIAALQRGKPVFAEKPVAADLAGAQAMMDAIGGSERRIVTVVDYEFVTLPAWQRTQMMLANGSIGRLRHAVVTWQVENESTRRRLKNWKTNGAVGGGALGNFVSHSVHTLEWLFGRVRRLTAQLSCLPDEPDLETTVTASLTFEGGASCSYAMSCAAFLGSGHRLELYGDDGTLVLANATADYMRGFTLQWARRPGKALEPVEIETDPYDRFSDGRIAPVARLAERFLNAIEGRGVAHPGVVEGYRAQVLLDAMRRADKEQRSVEIPA